MSRISILTIRGSLVLLFLWFSIQQLFDPTAWVAYLPEWTGYLPIPGEMLVRMNGWAELVGAVLLAVGLQTRVVAALLGLHLLGIAASIGGAVGVRDAALGLVTAALAFSEPDAWTLDVHLPKPPVATPTAVDPMPQA